jgi:hypothetical protein
VLESAFNCVMAVIASHVDVTFFTKNKPKNNGLKFVSQLLILCVHCIHVRPKVAIMQESEQNGSGILQR